MGTTTADLNTPPNASVLDCIRLIYGTKVSTALKKIEASSTSLKFKYIGLASSINYDMRKTVLLLFINRK